MYVMREFRISRELENAKYFVNAPVLSRHSISADENYVALGLLACASGET